MKILTIEGITAKTITTSRLTTRVLFSGSEKGIPVLFLHGNVSSATWWEENMLSLPPEFRGIAPDQRGFGESDPDKKIDATRGMGDLVDDAVSLLDNLEIEKAHLVGHSLGGMVIWEMMKVHSECFLSIALVAPGSPYGFGATKDCEGTPTTLDFAGSGGGLSNPELIKRLKEGDRTMESPFSPLSALRTLLVKAPFISEREDDLLSSMLTTQIGPQEVPGDSIQSPNWPFLAPGDWGASNATSPKHQHNIDKIVTLESKMPVLWVRGSDDLVVSDTATSDPGFLGRLGLLPGWPGEEAYPPQPMIGQIRAILEKYTAAGGSYKEVVIADAGHVPFLEKKGEFNLILHKHIEKSKGGV
jgi:pimeloyl-ACP methyl ester carboxylesterase